MERSEYRIIITDVDIPFPRVFTIVLKWMGAALLIYAAFVLAVVLPLMLVFRS